MELVRDGRVSTIIVKDLSRFGRNHIEVDTYLEQIFPFLNVTDNLYDDEFNEMIFRAIKLFAKISDDAEPVLELQKAELKSKVNEAAKNIRNSKDSISRYKHQKTELYMRYAMEEISEEEFTRKNDRLDKQIEKETLAIAQIEIEQR